MEGAELAANERAAWTKSSVLFLVHRINHAPDSSLLQTIKRNGPVEAPVFCSEQHGQWALHFLASEAQLWPEYRAAHFGVRRLTFEEIYPIIEAAFEMFKAIHEGGSLVGDFDDENLLVNETNEGLRFKLLLTRPLPTLADPAAVPPMETRAVDSPEFRNGEIERWSPSSDVYVIAAWLIGLLVGVSCFEEFREIDYFAHQLRALSPDVPFTLHPWFAKSSALDPMERYSSIAEQRSEFQRLCAASEVRRNEPQGRLRIGLADSSRAGVGKLRGEDDFRPWYDVNEDRALATWAGESDSKALAIVADGITNCRYGSGARAAEIVVGEVQRAWEEGLLTDPETLLNTLHRANEAVVQEAIAAAEMEGAELATLRRSDLMGATVAVCIVLEEKTHIAVCGDTRVYLWSAADGLALLSCDANQLNFDLRAGMSWKLARARDDAEVLRAYIGCNELGKERPRACEPEIWCETFGLSAGDVIVLCTDGLTDYLARFADGKGSWAAEAVLAHRLTERMLASEESVRGIKPLVEQLANEADRNGGGDNITLAMLRAETERPPGEAPPRRKIFGRALSP
jgi:serine/threonine protein phosphatase PrpC